MTDRNPGRGPAAVPPGTKARHPVVLKRDHHEGREMRPAPPWPATMLPRPMRSHRTVVWYTGEELTCMVYDSDDGVISFTDLPYDEHVYVLNGQAVLTSDDGRTDVFTKGDAFVAPKGWTGTWEMRGGYRELICFETRSISDAAKKWWPTL